MSDEAARDANELAWQRYMGSQPFDCYREDFDHGWDAGRGYERAKAYGDGWLAAANHWHEYEAKVEALLEAADIVGALPTNNHVMQEAQRVLRAAIDAVRAGRAS